MKQKQKIDYETFKGNQKIKSYKYIIMKKQ